MIKIEKAESYRICSHCYSKNDVMNIDIRYQCTNTGTQITLCKECCESMVNEIRRVDLNPKAAAVKDEDDTERRAPSAQPEIIRCRNCKFASGDSRICMKFGHSPIGELDFCAWAERRTDERTD